MSSIETRLAELEAALASTAARLADLEAKMAVVYGWWELSRSRLDLECKLIEADSDERRAVDARLQKLERAMTRIHGMSGVGS